MNTPHTHVWCEVCHAIRPLKIDDMHADDTTGHYTEASDLTCTVCSSVIATLYLPKPAPWQPTPENINALPEPLRRYVHQIETLSDPAGLVRQNAILKQQVDALLKKLGTGRE
jgi:hypothetical protein